MNREVHVRFCEGVGVKFPRATRPLIHTFLGFILAQDMVARSQEEEKGFLILFYFPLKHCLIIGCQHILFAQGADYLLAVILCHHRELRDSSATHFLEGKLNVV